MSIIQKKSLAQEVADRLIAGIVAKEYTIGDQLPIEPELMKMYGVGRSSIREAIKILSIQGVLRVQQGVGTFVVSDNLQESLESQINRAEIEEVLEVRSLIESKIAAKAALHHNEDELKIIKSYLDLRGIMAEKNQALECYEADINFHVSIAEACGNPLLKEIYKIASKQVMRTFENGHNNNTDAFKASHELHTSLYHSIKERNADRSAHIAQQIIDKLF
ncbi:FadR/GntR family transcriptional regulator [Chryseobacterium sp. SIMBA_029]|uniref:FadR/GntR family transcriptional regulator n=1 Tax=Chryseobacterium sp. SIMBA_029 TaxID=3085772 RepID=UPI003977FE25